MSELKVCIKPVPRYGLHADRVYKITDTMSCSCGTVSYAYGVRCDLDCGVVRCPNCMTYLGVGLSEWYANSNRFADVDSMLNEEIEELTETLKEPVTV
jgi:hypothetical protein